MVQVATFCVVFFAVVFVGTAVVFFDYVGFHFLILLFLCVCFFRMVLQETYGILDTKWYATDSDVMQWNTSSSGINTNYNSDRVINTGETLYIKLQNIPTSVVVGAVDGTGYCQLMKDNNQLRIYWTGSSENETGSLTTDTVMKLEIVSSTTQNWYINDTLLKQITNHTLSSPKAMIRKYRDYPVTVDIMYII